MIRQKNGYSLVLIVLMSTFIMAVLAGSMRIVTQSYIYSQEEYYYKLAQEAGEAGTAYANACLDSNNTEQSWGSVAGGIGPLRPETNCKGATAFYGNKYVFENSRLRTTFEVGNLEASTKGASSGVALSAATAQISSTGRVELISGGSVVKTYTAIVKKAVTWPADLNAARVVSGTFRTCALMSNNVWCWGNSNNMGTLGDGLQKNEANVPVKVRQVGDMKYGKIIDIFTAQFHSCVLTELSGVRRVYCWGSNEEGQLGNGQYGAHKYSAVPVEVGGDIVGKNITAIGGTGDVSCAIADSKIYCWGNNYEGELGHNAPRHPTLSPDPVPVATGGDPYWRLQPGYKAVKLSTSGSRSQTMCAIMDTGIAYCWGQAIFGQTGSTAFSPHYNYGRPVRVTGISNVTDISQDGYSYMATHLGTTTTAQSSRATHVCAIASGKVYCWGGAGNGQSGASAYDETYYRTYAVPKEVTGLPGVPKRIAVGLGHSCALVELSDGKHKVYCWGANEFGQLGESAYKSSSSLPYSRTPRPVYVGTNGLPPSEDVVTLAAGANRGCAIMTNKRAYCWGLNTDGQIGDGTHENRFSPTESLFLRPTQNRYIY